MIRILLTSFLALTLMGGPAAADGVEADGSLRLKLPDGRLRVISAGDVFFGEAA